MRGLATAVVAALALWAPCATARVCNQLSATSIVFTNFTPYGQGVAATATISYDCKNNVTAAWIGISFPRVMTAGGSTLQFGLYQDASFSSAWPDTPPLVAVPPVRNGSVTVYAYLPQQEAAAGLYQGTVVVSIYANTPTNRTDTANLVAQTTVAGTCLIDPATLAFGAYDSRAAAPLDAQTTIQISCTPNTTYQVGLGSGLQPSGSMRHMANGAYRLQYELYSDSRRTTVWDTFTMVGGTAISTAPVSLVVYGRIPPGQLVGAGAYHDVVQSTIHF